MTELQAFQYRCCIGPCELLISNVPGYWVLSTLIAFPLPGNGNSSVTAVIGIVPVEFFYVFPNGRWIKLNKRWYHLRYSVYQFSCLQSYQLLHLLIQFQAPTANWMTAQTTSFIWVLRVYCNWYSACQRVFWWIFTFNTDNWPF